MLLNKGAMGVYMIFRSENYIEGGSTWFFSKKFLSPIRTKLLSVIKNPGKFLSTQKKRLDKGNPTVQNSLPYVA
jgi:hypothetical protein